MSGTAGVLANVIRVWADTAQRGECRGQNCHAPIVFAETVKSAKRMPFTGRELVPLRTETDEQTGRQIYVMDFEESHFRKCPDAARFSAGKRV